MQLEEYAEKFIEDTVRNHKVVIFSWTYPQGYQARDLLTQIRVDFFEVEISREEHGSAIDHYLSIKTGQYTDPKIYIKGQFIGGFDELDHFCRSGGFDNF
ncbi:hypothetical protein RMATCC62417_10191 [Rhizopus microsporus]|nr:hypothetical protein RMATCC62417_10191 [Rhizopus microsporus]